MNNNNDNLYDNFYDSELIVEFLKGVLPGDLHLKIQEQIKTSGTFRTYVQGVQINFEQSGKNFEKMEANIAAKKAESWSKLQKKMTPATTLNEKLSYTLEQLKDFFRPNAQLELALQPRRTSASHQTQIIIDDIAKTLKLVLSEKNTQIIDFEIFDNKIQAIQKQEIPINSENFTLSTTSLRPGIYYAKLKSKSTETSIIRFYIREDLKPQ